MTNLIYMFVLNHFCEAEEIQWVKICPWINILYDLYIGKYCTKVHGI